MTKVLKIYLSFVFKCGQFQMRTVWDFNCDKDFGRLQFGIIPFPLTFPVILLLWVNEMLRQVVTELACIICSVMYKPDHYIPAVYNPCVLRTQHRHVCYSLLMVYHVFTIPCSLKIKHSTINATFVMAYHALPLTSMIRPQGQDNFSWPRVIDY